MSDSDLVLRLVGPGPFDIGDAEDFDMLIGSRPDDLGLLFTLKRPDGSSARIAIATDPDQLKRLLSLLVAIARKNDWDIPDPDAATLQTLRPGTKH